MLNWQDTYRLSRFALVRLGDNGFVIESSLTNQVLPALGPSVMRVIVALGRPVRLESLIMSVNEDQRPYLRAFLETCGEARLLARLNDDGSTDEETTSLGHWEFHDLLFHTSSRLGRNRRAIGGTYRLKNHLSPEPALRPVPNGPIVGLPQPSRGDVNHDSLIGVLERRRSRYGLEPLTVASLSDFLYRACRTTSILNDGDNTTVRRVYPSGGGLHPLSVYVAISSCNGCTPGLYAYEDVTHALQPIRGLDSTVQRLFSDARDSAGGLPSNPPALLLVSARFRRTAWKYESIAYRLILLEVGALFQTMYLVATAMGMTACALGCGDSDHFARAIGSDYYAETSVGEFLLGVDRGISDPA
jgi:oxazoline/thiazoline dehydrogenase